MENLFGETNSKSASEGFGPLVVLLIPDRKGENKQPKGNLARVTYSAYNGGPSAVGSCRGVRQSPTWKKVDEAFWEKFKTVSAGNEMAVKSCYEK